MQPISKIMRGEPSGSYHPFDDIAVVAEQPSRLLAVMTMIGARLLIAKACLADSALSLLSRKEFGEGRCVHAGARSSDRLLLAASQIRIGLYSAPAFFLIPACALAFAASLYDLWPSIIGPLSLLCGLACVVTLLLSEKALAVLAVVRTLIGEILGPLLIGAFGFLRSRHMHHLRNVSPNTSGKDI